MLIDIVSVDTFNDTVVFRDAAGHLRWVKASKVTDESAVRDAPLHIQVVREHPVAGAMLRVLEYAGEKRVVALREYDPTETLSAWWAVGVPLDTPVQDVPLVGKRWPNS